MISVYSDSFLAAVGALKHLFDGFICSSEDCPGHFPLSFGLEWFLLGIPLFQPWEAPYSTFEKNSSYSLRTFCTPCFVDL